MISELWWFISACLSFVFCFMVISALETIVANLNELLVVMKSKKVCDKKEDSVSEEVVKRSDVMSEFVYAWDPKVQRKVVHSRLDDGRLVSLVSGYVHKKKVVKGGSGVV